MLRTATFFAFGGILIGLIGCNRDGADRLAVKGTIQFNGKPLDNGSILFELEDRANPLLSGAAIEQGKFSIPQAQGLKPGTYLVRVTSGDPVLLDANQAPGESRPVAKERIPASWNSESKQKVDVKAGATDLAFDIK